MKQILFLVLLVISFSSHASSQTKEVKRNEKEITVCPIKLLVGAANFRFSYRYKVKTNNNGSVNEVKQIGKDNPRFIKDEDFVSCIEKWKLNSSEEYFVMIYVGTSSSSKNYISISSKTETIKINLPNIGMELVVDDKKKL